jgi:ABC-type glycerol-3-phosphate transport system permease component
LGIQNYPNLFAGMAMFLCTTGGYALAKFNYRFRNLLFVLILVSQMIPFHLLIVSLFLMITEFGMVETYWRQLYRLQPRRLASSSCAST